MSKCLKRNLLFLQFLNDSKDKNQVQAILKTATPSQVRALTEICNHLVGGHCKLDKNSRNILKKKVVILKKVASAKKPYAVKKRFISQKGGGFLKIIPVILKAILPSLIKTFI